MLMNVGIIYNSDEILRRRVYSGFVQIVLRKFVYSIFAKKLKGDKK